MPAKQQIRRKPLHKSRLGNVTITVQRCAREGFDCVAVMRRNGAREREKYCETRAEGKALFEAWCVDAGNVGAQAAAGITDADKVNLTAWRAKLAPYGKSLADAVAHFVAHLERCRVSITVAELTDRFITEKGRERKSARYISDLESRLGRFSADHGDRMAAEITTEEISSWLCALDAAPQTKVNFRRVLYSVFAYALTHRMIPDNPVRGSARPKVTPSEVETLTVTEAAALLQAAATPERAEILPAEVICLFGGVRHCEVQRLDWRAVNFDTGFIEIKAVQAKGGFKRRLVALRPTLRAWLEPHRRMAGPVWPAGERGRILHESAREAAGLVPWPHNALRHSFASYTLAVEQNAPALALEMGNSVKVIMRDYREVFTPAEGARFWNLLPADKAAPNVVPMAPPAAATRPARTSGKVQAAS